VDRIAIAAVRRNAEANGVTIEAECVDVLDDQTADSDVVLVGDGFYTQAMADRMMRFLRRCADAGKLVLVGDPDRKFMPRKHFTALARYDVPVRPVLEDVRVKPTTIWRLH
jgi:predicted nicotinamide N-methyase